MARILYGVAGEGFGHSSRAHLIGQHLIDSGHDLLFAASHKSLFYLRQYFADTVKEIMGMSLVYQHGKPKPIGTIATNVLGFLDGGHTKNTRLYQQDFDRFGPDIVITDFEPFTAWWAWRNGVPFISIDNEHLLTNCEIEKVNGSLLPRLNAKCVTLVYSPGAAAYIVVNFFSVPVKNDSTILAPPVVRPLLYSMKPSKGNHILVYSTDPTSKRKIFDALGEFADVQFFVYGCGEDGWQRNCQFKKISAEDFLRDLADSRAVIATGGFSLISECLYFRKKMLLVPILNQYEQMVNARYIEKLGLGRCTNQLDQNTLSSFLAHLDEPVSYCGEVLWPDNERFFEILQTTISQVLGQNLRTRSAVNLCFPMVEPALTKLQ
jgi:uncharacterized protein (TIGR00661 family)